MDEIVARLEPAIAEEVALVAELREITRREKEIGVRRIALARSIEPACDAMDTLGLDTGIEAIQKRCAERRDRRADQRAWNFMEASAP